MDSNDIFQDSRSKVAFSIIKNKNKKLITSHYIYKMYEIDMILESC